jgi:hypothetical protein
MGASSSSQKANALEEFYSKAIGKHMTTENYGSGSTLGGAKHPKIGGYSDLENYGNSMFSESKEKLIRGIAKDVSTALKIKPEFAEKGDIKVVIEKLKSMVPNPKNGSKIKPNGHMHKEVCMKLADSINKHYDMDVIDKHEDSSYICKKVGEVLYSLFTGLHTEFLTVSGDVARILKNLTILQDVVDSANQKLIKDLKGSSHESEMEAIKSLYKAVSDEIRRQQVVLSNITSSVIGPTGNSIINVLQSNDDFTGLTKDLSKAVGTPEFSEKLGLILTGSSDIVYTADLVNKALKDIGLSLAEYKAVYGLKELSEKIYDTIVKNRPANQDIYKMLTAADVLYKNDMAHDDIVAHLEKKTKGGAVSYDSSYADDADMQTAIDKDQNPFQGRPQSDRKSITKQVDQRTILRKQLFAALNNKFKDHYSKIKFSLSLIGKKLGNKIEVSPELEMLIKQLEYFAESQPDRHNLHIALSGYRKDLNSEYLKYQFMESLYAVSETLAPLASVEAFKDLKMHVDALIKLIVDFNTTFLKSITDFKVESLGVKGGACGCEGEEDKLYMSRYGDDSDSDSEHEPKHVRNASVDTVKMPRIEEASTETLNESPVMETIPESPVEEKAEGGGDFSHTSFGVLGGGDFDKTSFGVLGGIIASMPNSEFNHFVSMKRAISEIDYYFRIAGIKNNLVKVSHEYESNTENYENILGEEGAYLIDQIQSKYNKLIESLESEDTSSSSMDYKKLYADDLKVPEGSRLSKSLKEDLTASGVDTEDYKSGYKFLLEYVRSSKVEMLEAAQALDLYLSKFTKDIQYKPDQIKEFVQILEQIEVVAKWFTDKSGDKLASVFEAFTTDGVDTKTGVTKLTDNTGSHNELTSPSFSFGDKHYYDFVKTNNFKVGKFYQPRMMTRDQAINFVKQIEGAIKSVRALENIIAAFSRINTNASDEIKTFMSSGLMFKTFMKYSVASVISIGYLHKSDPATVASGFLPTPIASAHAKMAVGLKSNKNDLYLSQGSYLELSDPLSINSKSSEQDICDTIFEMSIKSIISKVFVVVGSYTLFNKPSSASDKGISLANATNPLRQILGGASPQVIVEAAELYVRLPLVAEWYKDIFEFKSIEGTYSDNEKSTHQGNPLISIIPDMDSIWGDLCKVIFVDARNITDGAYPSEYANRIISAINSIYTDFKSKNSRISCKEIISEFILDINRRYGFIMREEINAYLDEKYNYANSDLDQEYPDDDNVEYDILDVEMQIGRRSAPSDKFRTLSKSKSERKFTLTDLLKVVKRFRQSVEANLVLDDAKLVTDNQGFRTNANVSLNGIIDETKTNIKTASSPEEKYQIVHRQLHGIDQFGDLDKQRLILFHETVVTPLTVLYFIYSILDSYNKFSSSSESESVKNILNKLMDLGCDVNGFVEVAWIGANKKSYPTLVYDKLEELSKTLFNDAKQALHQLRKHIPNTLVAKYESLKNASGVRNQVSIFDLQDKLFDRLFDDKYKKGEGLSDANKNIKDAWIKQLENSQDKSQDINAITFWSTNALQNVTPSKFDKEFPAGYLSVYKSGNTLLTPESQSEVNDGANLINGTTNNLTSSTINGNISLQNLYNDDIASTLRDNVNTKLGLVQKFNNLVYRYMNIFIDRSTKKIYKPLIEKFVTGHNAKEIINDQNIDDLSGANVTNQPPKAKAVLFKSIAQALKNIFTTQSDKTFGTITKFTESDMLKISEYQKELMRANLPGFAKELQMIAHKAEFMRNVLEETNIVVKDDQTTISILDDIITSTKSLLMCVNVTQQELGDVPMYFETYNDSIVDYHNRNGHLPFTPLSNITYLFNFDSFETPDSYDIAIVPRPNIGLGSDNFKFTYGTRGLLYKQDPSLEFAPGVMDVLHAYNNRVDSSASFDKQRFANISKNIILLSRYVVDYMYHKKAVGSCDWKSSDDLLVADVKNLTCQTGRNKIGTDGTKKSIAEITNAIDNDNYRQSTYNLVSCIINDNIDNKLSRVDRKNLRVYNILDLNVVPINVHAMQREVPFINIANYSYTFDHIVKNFVAHTTAEIVDRSNDGKQTEMNLAKQLIYPLGNRSVQDYTGHIFKIMTGSDTLNAGRPKYLSDQLWNKVLLNSIYDRTDDLQSSIKPLGLTNAENYEFNTPKTVSRSLTYIKGSEVVPVSVGNENVGYEGYKRYNSKLVRYTEWFVQLQRVVRLLMRSQLDWVQDPVVQGNQAISEDVTEYKGASVFNIGDYE